MKEEQKEIIVLDEGIDMDSIMEALKCCGGATAPVRA